jgi:hypothetical protein
MRFPLRAGARKAPLVKVFKVPNRLGQFAVRFLCKAEIVGALDGHSFVTFVDFANNVEIVFLRFFVDHVLKCSNRSNSLP